MTTSSQNFEEIRIGAELIWGQRETESLFGTRKFQNFSKAGLLRDISSKTCFFLNIVGGISSAFLIALWPI